jgi:hypothetical protein
MTAGGSHDAPLDRAPRHPRPRPPRGAARRRGAAAGEDSKDRFLIWCSARSYAAAEDPLLQGLRELGYIEGQTITIERRFAEENLDRFHDLAAELVHLQVDLIVARAAAIEARAAMQATSTIPIVMATDGTNPVENGRQFSATGGKRHGRVSRAR